MLTKQFFLKMTSKYFTKTLTNKNLDKWKTSKLLEFKNECQQIWKYNIEGTLCCNLRRNYGNLIIF